ncbi:NADPH oxidase 5-like [Asterias rubens]|uniref:NADPH oxidase 5-like n=1 Tax=Asterias rubens TaxID=7604 RepID=UPI001454E95C|nr:NADPH oxidase 5-like [Asterias rubens]
MGKAKDRSVKRRRSQEGRRVRDVDSEWLQWAESQFAEIAGKDSDIDRESFKNALGIRNVFFADRFFDMFDDDNSGTISQVEMLNGLFLLNEGTTEDKIKFFFDVYDADHTGFIDRDELRCLVKTGMEESSVRLSEVKMDHLTDTLFTSADKDNSGTISFDEFMGSLRRYPDMIDNFSIGATAWLRSSGSKATHRKESGWLTRKAVYIRNNVKLIVFLLAIVLVNCALFAYSAYRYSLVPDTNAFLIIARGCGMALNFSGAVVGIMMLRKALSFLRSTWLIRILPFDHTIGIHKKLGYLILTLSFIHTVCHVGNAFTLQSYKNFTALELLLTDPSLVPVGLQVGRLEGSAFITGWLLDAVLLVLIVGSLSFVRRSGHFEVFFWTHKICYMLFWVLLILHGPNFWCWFVGPAVLLLLEAFSETTIVKALRFGKTYVKEVNLLPSGVTHLVLTRPSNFKYQAGDYIFIQIPKMAPHEWHPFTISSAPEQMDVISVHVRSAGNWTKCMYQYFDLMTSLQRPHKVSVRGNVNRGFEMSSATEGVNDGTIATVFETSIEILDDDGDSEIKDVHEDGPQVLKIRKFQPPSKVNPSGPDIAPGSAAENQEPTVKPTEIQNEEQKRNSSNMKFDLKTKGRIRVHIQGPYGTPSTSIFQSEHAVLIGAGIGVTPFASIVQSIIYRHHSILNECPNCNHSWVDNEKQERALRVKKVDFIWMNRNYMAFEWFVDLLLHLENEQSHYSLDRFLDIHLFMTGMKRFDMKNIGLQMALDLVHEKEERDLLTGLRTKLQAGRPDWKKLFNKLKSENKGKVSVYFCGAPALGAVIRSHCNDFNFTFHKEKF